MSDHRPEFVERWEQRARGLKTQTYALVLAFRDPRTPWYAKAFAAVVVAYAFSPIDLVPDFIPVLGYLDDLVLVPAGVALALKMIPAAVMDDAQSRARQAEQDGLPVSRAAAAAVIAVWLALLGLAVVLVVRLLR